MMFLIQMANSLDVGLLLRLIFDVVKVRISIFRRRRSWSWKASKVQYRPPPGCWKRPTTNSKANDNNPKMCCVHPFGNFETWSWKVLTKWSLTWFWIRRSELSIDQNFSSNFRHRQGFDAANKGQRDWWKGHGLFSRWKLLTTSNSESTSWAFLQEIVGDRLIPPRNGTILILWISC